MSRLTLKRKASLTCYKIHAEVAEFSGTSYVLVVLTYVDENPGRATAASMSEDLFGNSYTIGRKLLELCSRKGLVSESGGTYTLTGEGRDALRNGMIPVPSDGIWKIHVADDPLIPPEYRILKIERTYDVELDGGPVKGQAEPEIAGSDVTGLEGCRFLPSFGNPIPVRIRNIGSHEKRLEPEIEAYVHLVLDEDVAEARITAKGTARPGGNDGYCDGHFKLLGLDKDATMRAVNERATEMIHTLMERDGGRDSGNQKIERIRNAAWQIRFGYDYIQGRHGTMPPGERRLPPQENNPYREAWERIREGAKYRKDEEHGVFLVRYEDTKPEERHGMSAILDGSEISLEGYGTFQLAGATIPIYPATGEDAEKWARDLAEAEMESEYVTKKRYLAIRDMVRAKFPHHEGVLGGERSEYVPGKSKRQFWNIQAMEDWDL